MLEDLHARIPDLIATYGYWFVGGIIGLESMGIPLPGEATLIAASIYAGNTHRLGIALLILAAAAGAIVGDNAGYWIGRGVGFPLLVRHGRRVGISESKLKLGQYLFSRYGGAVVFFGRFVTVLRALAALLAGANRMGWHRFMAYNAAGGIVWSASYGLGAYLLGRQIDRFLGPAGLAALFVAVVALSAAFFAVRRHGAALQAAADAALPGPLVKSEDAAR